MHPSVLGHLLMITLTPNYIIYDMMDRTIDEIKKNYSDLKVGQKRVLHTILALPDQAFKNTDTWGDMRIVWRTRFWPTLRSL